MKRAYFFPHKGTGCISTTNGRIIVATTPAEALEAAKIFKIHVDLEDPLAFIIVTEWMADARNR